MKFHSFALLAAIAPIAVQSHVRETRYCITDEASPNLRIFILHTHGPTGTAGRWIYPGDDLSEAGTMTIGEAGNPTDIIKIPDFFVFETDSNSIGSTSLRGAACTGGTTTLVKTCGENDDKDWVVYDFPLTCNQQATYTLKSAGKYILSDRNAGECPVDLYPSVISATFPCPSDAPSLNPSSAPSSSSSPSSAPSSAPSSSSSPSSAPSSSPSSAPSLNPSSAPSSSSSPSSAPSSAPSSSSSPSSAPSSSPSSAPSLSPSSAPSLSPSSSPSSAPSLSPSSSPSSQPSLVPSRTSKKGKKSWRLEREARDPNFPPKAKSGKIGHGTPGGGGSDIVLDDRGDGVASTKAPKSTKSPKSS